VTIHDATLDLCMQAAALKAEHPVALGDCFAAALARKLNAALVTGDPEFRKLGKLIKVKWL
jgi:ribonuclease VapC